MIAEGTDAKSVTDEQITQVAADVELARRSWKIDKAAIAKAVGYSASTISEFCSGKYKGDRGQVAIDLDNWLADEERRRDRPATTQFVWTNVASEIKAVAGYCLDHKTIGLVYGPDTSGIGKTTALKAIHYELGPRRSSLLTIDKVDANSTGVLRKLCQSIGVQDSGANKQRSDRIVTKLTGRSHLLIVDQAHNMRWAKNDLPFYILTDIFDATGTAQLWCGTSDLVSYLERQQSRNSDESLAQLRRRIFPRIDLMEGVRAGGRGEPLVTVEQVRAMFAKNKLKLTDTAARFICRLGNQPDSGSIGVAVQIVQYATMLGEMRNLKSIDETLLQEALRRGFSSRRTELLLASMDIEQRPMKAAAAG
jgi:DNA transposition AAA+ family ATPase